MGICERSQNVLETISAVFIKNQKLNQERVNMAKEAKVKFAGGCNIAMKVPPHLWEETVQFYEDVLDLKVIEKAATVPQSVGFEFGLTDSG